LSLVLFCFLLLIPSPPNSTLFPYTTLFRSGKDDSMNASSGVRAGGSGLLVSLYRDLDLDDVADQEAPCLQSHIPVQAKVFAIDLRPGLEADGLRRTRHGHLSTSGELGIQHHFARDSSNRQVSDHLVVIMALWLDTGAFERHEG